MARQKRQWITVLVIIALCAALQTGCGSTGETSAASPPPTPANLTATPSTADFGTVLVGTTASRTIVLNNSGGSAATITSVNTSDPSFGVSGLALPSTVAPGAGISVSVTVSPSAAGNISGSVSFISNAGNSPTTVSITGTATTGAVAQISVSPGVIDFGSITVNTTATRTLTISNTGTATLNVNSAPVNGAAFSISGTTFPLTINQGAATNLTVTFAPGTVGNQSGSITINSNASNLISPIGLSGSATPAPNPLLGASPANVSFGQVAVGSSSTRTVTLTNNGNVTVTISAATMSGSGVSVTGIAFPRTVSVGASTTATVRFAPTASGNVTGSVSFVSNANNSPAVVSVSGSGFVPVQHFVDLTWNPSASAVAGYRVYRSTQQGGGYQAITTSLVPGLAFTDDQVQSGRTFFYVVTAVDAQGVESFFSNEVSAVIPIP